MDELKTKVVKQAENKDWVPSRELLDEVGHQLPVLPIKDPLRDWWVTMVLWFMNGQDEPTRKTRGANQLLLLAERPQEPDKNDWKLDW